jgi:hypothetical protein
MKRSPLPLSDRIQMGIQACRAGGLLSVAETLTDAETRLRAAEKESREQSTEINAAIQVLGYLLTGEEGTHVGHILPMAQEIADRIDKLEANGEAWKGRAQRAEAASEGRERDAERYRWLRNTPMRRDLADGEYYWSVAKEYGGMGTVLRAEKLDAAIDAALSIAAPEGEGE